jgi:thioredoxin 1
MRETLNEGRVLVDFFAEWCGPCKVLKPIVEKFGEDQSEVKVVMLNVDEYSDIATEFGIRSIPTLVYLENGEVVNRVTGTQSSEQLFTLTNLS